MKIEKLTLTNFNGRKFNITTYTQDQDPKLLVQKKPLMIILPGGSFNHHAMRESEPVALAYASKGFNCAIVYYNLITDPGLIYPDAGLDGLKVVQYYREHAQEYHIDPNKIAVCGFSAGGHVASAMASMIDAPSMINKFKFDPEQVRPNATILGYPLIDIEKIGYKLTPEEMTYFPKEDYLRNTSLGVTNKTAPTFIFQAWDDPTVMIDNSLEYLNALNNKHVRFEAHLFEAGGHGFSLATPELEQTGRPEQVNNHVAHWFDLSIEWLRRTLK